MLALILCSIDDVLNKDRYDKQKTPTHVGVFLFGMFNKD